MGMPYFALPIILFSKILNFKTILHEQNIEFMRFKSFNKSWWLLMYLYEYFAYKCIDQVFYISNNDKKILINSFRIPASKLL